MIWRMDVRLMCWGLALVAIAGCSEKQPPRVVHRRSAAIDRIIELGPWQARYERERAVFLQNADVAPRNVPNSFAEPRLRQIYQNAYREGFVQASSPEGSRQPVGSFDPATLADKEASAEWFGWNAGREAGQAAALDWFRAALDSYEQAARSASQDSSP